VGNRAVAAEAELLALLVNPPSYLFLRFGFGGLRQENAAIVLDIRHVHLCLVKQDSHLQEGLAGMYAETAAGMSARVKS
jgi:hypothetical protein